MDEALVLSARLGGVERSAVPEAVARVSARCGLADVRSRLVDHLSAGYRQRLGIACAIVHDPEVVLLDEPGSALDPAQIRDLRKLISELGRDRAVLFSTHVLAEVQALANRVAVLHAGRIVHDAPLDGVATRVRLSLRQYPEQEAIAALEGVSAVERLDKAGSWVVTLESGDASLARFAADVVARGWGLLALEPGYDPLEARFLALTSSNAA